MKLTKLVESLTDEEKSELSEILKPKRKIKAEIDDTSAFGWPHHNHKQHRVYVDGLNYEQAQVIRDYLNTWFDEKYREIESLKFI